MRISAKPIGHTVHSYEMYPSTPISRSKFDRSNSLLTTMNAGYLVPIWFDEAYPGDTVSVSCSTLTRLATQIVPFMDNVYMDVHFWCVPYRLVWSHWKNFNGEQTNKYDPANPAGDTDYLTPQLNSGEDGVAVGSIYDYFGVPTGVPNLSFNSFNFRAYNLVYNEWYRDENLIDPVIVRQGDNGVDLLSDFTLLKRGKRKDYFTSCLPFPQKGETVDLPLGLTAPILSDTNVAPVKGRFPVRATQGTDYTGTPLNYFIVNAGYSSSQDGNNLGVNIGGKSVKVHGQTQAAITSSADNPYSSNVLVATAETLSGGYTPYADLSDVQVDLTNATASTINSLRMAFAIQRMLEADSRGGSRYVEFILSHFGVKSPDDRLQRPEFLGGGTFNLNLNIVPQTSGTQSTGTPLGNLASYGVINGHTKRIVHSFTEHCIVFAVASIRADMTYQQGLDRSYSRRQRTDYYLPTLANLGEQAVLNKEIYAQGASVVVGDGDDTPIDDLVFGYQERWAEMRHKMSRLSGQIRSSASQSLDIWTLSQYFQNLPTLNKTFIEENPPIDRVVAVTGENVPQFISNFYFNEYWIRPLPVYSIPSMSSHF